MRAVNARAYCYCVKLRCLSINTTMKPVGSMMKNSWCSATFMTHTTVIYLGFNESHFHNASLAVQRHLKHARLLHAQTKNAVDNSNQFLN